MPCHVKEKGPRGLQYFNKWVQRFVWIAVFVIVLHGFYTTFGNQKPRNRLRGCILQVVHQCGALGIGGAAGFEEVGFDEVGVTVFAYPLHGVRLFHMTFVYGIQA